MPTTPPPPELLPGYEVPTKHKEAICQLHGFTKIPIEDIMDWYKLSKSGVRKILDYEAPEWAWPTRTGWPHKLNDLQVHKIIEYCSQSWEHQILDYIQLQQELDLACSAKTLEQQLKQCGYFCCVACQKPYLTLVQAHAWWIWGINHIFWWKEKEWRKVLWSDEVIFLVGGCTVKQRVTRNKHEWFCSTCIQHQFHRGHTTPVNAWGVIG